MKLLHSLPSRSRFHDAVFTVLDGVEVLLVACDDHKARLYKDISSAPAKRINGDDETSGEADEEEGEEDGSPMTLFAELAGHKNR
jgi:hypothetical protein